MKMKESRIRIGIVGTGFGEKVHLPAFRSEPACQVVGICSSHLEQAKAVADKHQVPKVYDDWRKMVEDPNLDAISIAVVPSLQPDIAAAALRMGKAVFCEKPLGASLENIKGLRKMVTSSTAANMMDFEFPELKTWQKAEEILEEGGLGKLRHVAVSWNVETYANKMGIDSWKTRIPEGGGTLNHYASHSLYYLEWFAGPVSALFARTFRKNRLNDTFSVLYLKMRSGTPVLLSTSTHAFLGNGHRLEFYGEKGTLLLESTSTDVKGFRLFYGNRSTNRLGFVLSEPEEPFSSSDGRIGPVSRLAKRFVHWIDTGTASTPTLKAGIRVQELLDAAWKSDESGNWIQIAE